MSTRFDIVITPDDSQEMFYLLKLLVDELASSDGLRRLHLQELTWF